MSHFLYIFFLHSKWGTHIKDSKLTMWGNMQDVYFCFWVTSITTVISSSIYWLLRYGVSISGSQLSYCCKPLIQLLTLWSPPIIKLFFLFSIAIILLLRSISVPKTTKNMCFLRVETQRLKTAILGSIYQCGIVGCWSTVNLISYWLGSFIPFGCLW